MVLKAVKWFPRQSNGSQGSQMVPKAVIQTHSSWIVPHTCPLHPHKGGSPWQQMLSPETPGHTRVMALDSRCCPLKLLDTLGWWPLTADAVPWKSWHKSDDSWQWMLPPESPCTYTRVMALDSRCCPLKILDTRVMALDSGCCPLNPCTRVMALNSGCSPLKPLTYTRVMALDSGCCPLYHTRLSG